MNRTPSLAELSFRIIGLALLGFAAIMLAGPILALAGVVLSFALVLIPFALIGLLVWVTVQVVTGRRDIAWERVQQMNHAFQAGCYHGGKITAKALSVPVAILRQAGTRAGRIGRAAWNIARTTGRMTTEIVMLAVTGAMVGTGAELCFGPNKQDPRFFVPLNILLGGMIGALVAVVMFFWERKKAKNHAASRVGHFSNAV